MLFDQRGCGKSPAQRLAWSDNTTWALIEDIERLRERTWAWKSWSGVRRLLGLDPCAGLRHHPPRAGRVSLILRGIFLLTEREL